MRKASMKILTIIGNDEEIKLLKQQWKEIFPTKTFPGFNLDFYAGLDDYKQKIKDTIKLRDYSIIRDAVKLVDLANQR